MDKKPALIIAFLVTCLIIINYFSISYLKENPRQTGFVMRVLDGDTLELENGEKIRLLNINTPEKNEEKSKESIEFTRQLVNKTIEFQPIKRDLYNRTLARVYYPDYLNLKLVNLGLANKYLVENSEKKKFLKAEEDAIKSEIGIWNKSDFSYCIKASLDAKNELVKIYNDCNIVMENLMIKDEGRNYYYLNVSSNLIKVHTGKGMNTQSDIFMGKTNIWNNDADTLYIFDKDQKLVYHYAYGY